MLEYRRNVLSIVIKPRNVNPASRIVILGKRSTEEIDRKITIGGPPRVIQVPETEVRTLSTTTVPSVIPTSAGIIVRRTKQRKHKKIILGRR